MGNGQNIALGDYVPGTADHTDFGNASLGGGSVTRTFTVQNVGSGTLNVAAINPSGTHAANFTVGALTPAGPIAGGGSATFTVTFAPSALGLRSATITVQNDDCNEAFYAFAVQGTGVNNPPTVTRDNATVTVNEGQTAVNTGTFSDAEGNATATLTASIGTITPNNGAGTWSWSYNTSVGQASTTVTITANDGVAAPVTTTFTLAINHAPTAINGPLTIVEDFDYGASAGTLATKNGGAGFSGAWGDGFNDATGGSYTPTGLTFGSLSAVGGAWNGNSGSRNFAAILAAAGPIRGDFLFKRPLAPGAVQMLGLGGVHNQIFTLALAPVHNNLPSTPPQVGLQGGGFADVGTGALDPNTTYMYRFSYAGSSITAWILIAAQYDNFAPGGLLDADLNAASIGSGATQVTGRATKVGVVVNNMANLYTYSFQASGTVMDRVRITGTPGRRVARRGRECRHQHQRGHLARLRLGRGQHLHLRARQRHGRHGQRQLQHQRQHPPQLGGLQLRGEEQLQRPRAGHRPGRPELRDAADRDDQQRQRSGDRRCPEPQQHRGEQRAQRHRRHAHGHGR